MNAMFAQAGSPQADRSESTDRESGVVFLSRRPLRRLLGVRHHDVQIAARRTRGPGLAHVTTRLGAEALPVPSLVVSVTLGVPAVSAVPLNVIGHFDLVVQTSSG